MHAIIVGCGRVGSTVARQLDRDGHDVVVIDRKPAAFSRLGELFGGRTITGVGFDRDVLMSASITADSSVMAVTNGDNSNILITRVAREMFGVHKVVARIYDPRRAEVYERLGIATVATVTWASTRVLQLVQPTAGDVAWTDPTSSMVLVERVISPDAAGRSLGDLQQGGARVVLVSRLGAARHVTPHEIAQDGDRLHILGTSDEIAEFDLALAGEGGHP